MGTSFFPIQIVEWLFACQHEFLVAVATLLGLLADILGRYVLLLSGQMDIHSSQATGLGHTSGFGDALLRAAL